MGSRGAQPRSWALDGGLNFNAQVFQLDRSTLSKEDVTRYPISSLATSVTATTMVVRMTTDTAGDGGGGSGYGDDQGEHIDGGPCEDNEGDDDDEDDFCTHSNSPSPGEAAVREKLELLFPSLQ
ncbi:Threonine Synthase-Like 2 [Manis pentadactyla]|nr:Threonine Synthase-Like 2 [Manis pentadactyla]